MLLGFESRGATLTGSLHLSGGRLVDGAWTRGKRIGVGSSGEVYFVRDEARSMDFAAKLVVPRDAEAAARLDKEIELMRHMRHRNIVQYIGSAMSGDERYILLELCQGGSVRQLLEREHRQGLPPAILERYGVQTLNGLNFLHEHLVIHRDLKGENLLLADAERTTVKIADFGSSHELQAGATLSHDVATQRLTPMPSRPQHHPMPTMPTDALRIRCCPPCHVAPALAPQVAAIRGSPYWMSPEHILGSRCGRKVSQARPPYAPATSSPPCASRPTAHDPDH